MLDVHSLPLLQCSKYFPSVCTVHILCYDLHFHPAALDVSQAPFRSFALSVNGRISLQSTGICNLNAVQILSSSDKRLEVMTHQDWERSSTTSFPPLGWIGWIHLSHHSDHLKAFPNTCYLCSVMMFHLWTSALTTFLILAGELVSCISQKNKLLRWEHYDHLVKQSNAALSHHVSMGQLFLRCLWFAMETHL